MMQYMYRVSYSAGGGGGGGWDGQPVTQRHSLETRGKHNMPVASSDKTNIM